VKDTGALAVFVANKSSGMKFSAKLDAPQEKDMVALGEALFNRRSGPFDFACTTCHAEAGKRIRLQPLAHLSSAEGARKVIGEWPAYRVSSTNVMTMQHRLVDCYWQMRMPAPELGSELTVALISYLTKQATGGEISAPGLKR
jgi:sulfur-oxidizing protein SoxA